MIRWLVDTTTITRNFKMLLPTDNRTLWWRQQEILVKLYFTTYARDMEIKNYIFKRTSKNKQFYFFKICFSWSFMRFFWMFLSNTISYLLRADDWSIAVTLSFYKFSYKPKYSKNKNIMLIIKKHIYFWENTWTGILFCQKIHQRIEHQKVLL